MPQLNEKTSKLEQGIRLLAQGDYKALHAFAIRMIERDVRDAVPYFLLGQLTVEHGNYRKALELFEKAVAYDPGNALYLAHLAKTLTSLNRQNEAREVALHASKQETKDAYIADTIGVVLSRTANHTLALPLFERAVALAPSKPDYHYNLGSSLQFLGQLEEAKSAYLNAISLDQSHHRAWSSLVGLSRQTEENNYVAVLSELFETASNDSEATLHYGHAIAKSLEDLGRFEDSFDWLKRAKQQKRLEIKYDPKHDLQNFKAARATLEAPFSSRTTKIKDAPIFIVGLPRTGTTLIDRILSSHKDVVSAGELNTFAGLIKSSADTTSNLILDEETLIAANSIDLTHVGREYIRETMEFRNGCSRVTDKMPFNFFYAGLIHRALPNARIIMLRRHAMDSCLSNYRQLFATGYSYYNYTLDLADIAAFYSSFHELSAHWRATIPSSRFVEVHYESVVSHQERETRRLLEFCDLEWDENCLRFHENEAPVSTASSVQVRQPIYSGSIGRWKRYGDKLHQLASQLGDLASVN